MSAWLVVRDMATGEVVSEWDVTQRTDRERERTLMGLIRQMDQDRYYAAEETR